MGDSVDPRTKWNCLVKSATSDAIHAASVNEGGVLQEIACHTRGKTQWELTQPEKGTSYAACGRCIQVGAFRDIPGVVKSSPSSFELSPELYDPPFESLRESNR